MNEHPSPPVIRSIWRTFALPVAFTTLFLGWLTWDRYEDCLVFAQQVNAIHVAEKLRGQILFYSEIENMSAHMASVTGDPRWEARYRAVASSQAQALHDALLEPMDSTDAAFVARTQAADQALDGANRQVFELARQGNLAAAQRLLADAQHEAYYKAYIDDMEGSGRHLDQATAAEIEAILSEAKLDVATTIALTALLAFVWWRVLQTMHRWRLKMAQDNRQLVQQADDLNRLSAGLNKKVEERTRELKDAVVATMNMMQDATSSRERVQESYDALSREMAQRKTLEQESRDLGAMVNNAHDAIFVCDTDQRIRSWNAGAERMYGWSTEEAVGKRVEDLLYRDPEEYRGIIPLLLESDDWKGTLKQVCKDGSLVTIEAHKTLFRDEQGRPKSILAINTDITAQLALEERIQQTQRLDALGQLTGGVAHDFNNLLTVIYGNSELLVEQLITQPRLRELATMTMTAAQRGADLTHRLLAFARKQPLESAVVDVNGLLANMAALLSRTLSETIRIQIVHGAGLWPVIADVSQLENAVLNLAINARDAMPDGGQLIIETSNAIVDESFVRSHSGLEVGRYVLLSVSDTGKGIRHEDLQHVFEPFFTTKEFGKGTGLGLSMIYGFVTQSRGHVSIYSEPGKGTTVKMYLPTATDISASNRDVLLPDIVVGGRETILLVEDDQAVRCVSEDQLRKLGYEVLSVADGAQALDALRNTPDIGLLFTDMVMPGGMSGTELAKAAIALRPGLSVLYTSGYVQGNANNNSAMPTSGNFLSKPYSRVMLAAKIRTLLSENGATDMGESP